MEFEHTVEIHGQDGRFYWQVRVSGSADIKITSGFYSSKAVLQEAFDLERDQLPQPFRILDLTRPPRIT